MPTLHLLHQAFHAFPGHDQAALAVGTQEPGSIVENCMIDALGADWALKMSGNIGSTFNACEISGGTERALDIVQGRNIAFNDCHFDGLPERKPVTSRFNLHKQTDIGIKGGAQNIGFNDCVMTDLLIGDFSIYDHDGMGSKVEGITLNNCRHHIPGNKIIIRVLWGEVPTCLNTEVSVLKVPDLIVRAYFAWCRRFGDSRVPVMGAPVPEIT